MNISDLTHPVVRDAITAINDGDRDAWFALFSSNTAFTDDGETREFVTWSDDELFVDSRAKITGILREEDHGHTVYTRMTSDKWGDMETFWRFQIADGEVKRLDVGQA